MMRSLVLAYHSSHHHDFYCRKFFLWVASRSQGSDRTTIKPRTPAGIIQHLLFSVHVSRKRVYMWDFSDLARAVLRSSPGMFANSNAASIRDSTLTSVGGDAHTTSYDTAAESIQAGVNHVGRDQNFYNVAAAGSDTADKMRGTAVGIMINGKGANVKLLKDNKFTITAANPHGIIEEGEDNTIFLGEGNTFTLRQAK